ncbi:S8 family serine peptidase [Effusibacillus pohliae]|uniref:S8 family serine peptidase n=1 Tax=Effusibacillus pohliae TaxID=232270 RepID=UPI0014615817|nr:S8 family serine peptidase [Effusibacillus pohliae]
MKNHLISAFLTSVLITVPFGSAGLPQHQAYAANAVAIDPSLLSKLDSMGDADTLKVILTYSQQPTQDDLNTLKALGIPAGTVLHELPMVIATLTKLQIQKLVQSSIANLQSVYADKQLHYFLDKSVAQIGAAKNRTTPSMGYSGKGVGVAVVDSGIDGTHPDLKFGSRVIQNVKVVGNETVSDFVAPSYLEGVPDTDNAGGHGTHVAGIIGGDGTASGGRYEGVAPAANLIGVSAGATLLITAAVEGLDYVLTHQYQYNIKVVSNSWGTTGSFDPNDPINQATKILHDRGITVVFAMGNEGPSANTQNPYAVAPWVIGVAAGTKDTGLLADFSSRGIRDDALYHPTITAPGVDIISARAKQSVLTPLSASKDAAMIQTAYQPYYTTMSGTSMATPHISGVVALLTEANPALTPDQVKQILMDTATRMPGYQAFEVGSGFVNAYAAIDKAQHMERNYGAVLNQTFNAKFKGYVDALDPTDTVWDPTTPVTFTMNVNDNAVVSDLTIAWDNPANLLQVIVTAPDGSSKVYSAYLLSAVYGTQTSITLQTPQKGTWKVEVSGYRGTIGVPDTVHFSYRTYYGTFTGLNDVAGTPYESAIRAAVSKRLIDSANANEFKPDQSITKGELARWIASDLEIRQNLTQPVPYSDVSSFLAPFVAAVTANAAPMRDIFWTGGSVMSACSATRFGTNDKITRSQLAVALVKAMGLDELARQNMNTKTSFTDDDQIPPEDRGYVVVATQKGIMKGYVNQSTVEGAAPTFSFRPNETVTRGSLAYNLMNTYNFFMSGK